VFFICVRSADRAFDPISEHPLPPSLCSGGVAVPLLWPGSSSRSLRSLLEALPIRIGADSHPRLAAMTSPLDSSLARDEPNELPDCSTPRQSGGRALVRGPRVSRRGEAVSMQLPDLSRAE